MKSIVVLSGGMDSTTLLYWALEQGHEVEALSVLYGQRHRRELLAAKAVAESLRVSHEVADLSSIGQLFAGSALTGTGDVPHGHYEDISMKRTVVPNRNMVLLSLAIAMGVRDKADAVLYGAHAGDHAIYPDCRLEFVQAMMRAASLADWHPIRLKAPFLEKSKAQIAKLGHELGVPFERTWSCYEGGEQHCGKCGTCVERQEAFKLAEVPDPTDYAP